MNSYDKGDEVITGEEENEVNKNENETALKKRADTIRLKMRVLGKLHNINVHI